MRESYKRVIERHIEGVTGRQVESLDFANQIPLWICESMELENSFYSDWKAVFFGAKACHQTSNGLWKSSEESGWFCACEGQ